MKKRGHLFVISAPSGAGKTTIWQKIVEQVDGVVHSVSLTTRAPRPGEVDGKDYFFIDEDRFKKYNEEGLFLEWARVFGCYYGTPRDKVEQCLDQGKDVILSIDVQGAKQVKEKFPEAILVFIVPPDLDVLGKRLRMRRTDSEEEIRKRLNEARKEMIRLKDYDYKIVNDNLKSAVQEFKRIISSVRNKRSKE